MGDPEDLTASTSSELTLAEGAITQSVPPQEAEITQSVPPQEAAITRPVAPVLAAPSAPVAAPSAPVAAPSPLVPAIDAAPGPRPTLDHQQKRHQWWLASVIVVLCASAGLSMRILGGSPDVQRVFAIGLAATSAAGIWLAWLARTPTRSSPRTFAIAWFVCSLGICAIILYFGVFSTACMVAVLAIFFVGVNDELPSVYTVYGTLAAFHAGAVVVLLIFGFRDPGIGGFPENTGVAKIVVMEVLVQAVLLGTVGIALVVRRSVVKTVQELEQSARVAGHYEVLLEDAKNALVHSLRSVGGGRFSYQTFGSYRLGRLLGEGSMGEVYEAIDTKTGATAAVKLLRREVLSDASIVRRFLTEARIVASLQSAHVVRVLETGDVIESQVPYIVMERLTGHDLRNVLKLSSDGRVPAQQVLELLRQVARGIDAAHLAGIVHRDLKPSNLFQVETGTWKILDFGVSKVVGEQTADNAIVGTPHFMAPEQVSGGELDGRVDVFALGVITYRALTGKLPFTGKQLAEVFHQILHHTPVSPSRLVAALPSAIDDVVSRALAKTVSTRYATAGAFAEAFAVALATGVAPR